jgi:hypothetical protein
MNDRNITHHKVPWGNEGEVTSVGMHVDLCSAGVCMHVLRHGVPVLLRILKVFPL